jgi:hypothetical protein
MVFSFTVAYPIKRNRDKIEMDLDLRLKPIKNAKIDKK